MEPIISNGTDNLENILEALFFVSGKPFRAKDFAKILELDEAGVKAALDSIADKRKDGGVVLLNNNGEYQLATNSKYSVQVKNFLNAELREKLTDATVEVLAIIAYRQPISKAEIEAIRGVNSQYSLRNLLIRGLIEKVGNPADARSFLYQTTTEFLMHLGLVSTKDLPEFEKLTASIKLPETPALAQQVLPESREPEHQSVNINEPVQNQPATDPAATADLEVADEEFESDDEEDGEKDDE